ncbi:MAG: diacylglycerol/lipid kinase family protein [Candidatus Heimdallarchaeaceae archaeon]
MSKPNYLFIVNPHARNGMVGKKWPKVELEIKRKNMDYEVKFTERPKHAIEIAKDNRDDYEVIIACGGDGTVNEVVNGLYGGKSIFGVLPLGNGNDFGTLLDYDDNYIRSLEILQAKKTTELNVGIAEGDKKHYFVNIAETGVTSIIAKAAYTDFKWARGLLKYYLIAMKKIMSFNRVPAVVTIDGKKIDTELILCAIGLGYRFGGGFNVLPGNKPYYNDFQICIVGDVPKWQWYYMINKVKSGKHASVNGVHILRGKEVTIDIEKPLPIEAEGEIFSEYSTRATFTLASERIKAIAPEEFIMEKRQYDESSN